VDRLPETLAQIVGPSNVLTDPAEVTRYVTDWTGAFSGTTTAVVRPADVAQVAAVVEACRAAGAAVVPQGGNTGLVGGGIPHAGEVLLSLERLAGPPDVDALTGQATVAAGVAIETVQAAARAAGWDYGVNLASRGSATMGGTIATNAGGLRVLRYGDTRAQLVGVEAATTPATTCRHCSPAARGRWGS
jgi:FAD/FMN-containing dehydrogenase